MTINLRDATPNISFSDAYGLAWGDMIIGALAMLDKNAERCNSERDSDDHEA